ncbi:aBC-2 type transporter [Mycoplasma sp. CAG:877]|nr:aBC-2 type transporter [Mycoplasma sp. CAG:877]
MFLHNFKYSLKTLLRNKGLIFWTFAFPIILGTLFNLAFSDIENKETLDIIDIAIVNNEEFKTDTYFTESFKVLSKKKEPNQLFDTKYTDLSTAQSLLKENKITGYLLFENHEVKITVNDKGYNETILRFVVDELSSQKEMLETITTKEVADSYKSGNQNVNYEKIYQDTLNLINNTTPKLNNISNSNLSYTMIEYYTLLAMACLYGALIAMFVTNKKIANMSSAGKRTSISPAHKKTLLLGSFLASYLVQLLGILILYLYTILVIKVDYGNNTFLVFLLLMAGSLAGLTLGIAISTVLKSNENTKTGILISLTMLASFLSGMMGITMKYIIDTNIPILNKINPAAMITDGFYSLYYYSTLDRFCFNIISLIIFSIIMLVISYQGLRREKYDSI